MKRNIICIVGNPNCGKTTLFNALTGSRQEVGNWPGVTVDKKTGRYSFEGEEVEIVDLPGIYSVTPASNSGEDERVARDYILSGEAQAVINIVDASNLERNLYLTAQLLEMRVPMMVVVNMLDIAQNHGMQVDLNALERELGCPVVGVVASRGQGVRNLRRSISEFLKHPAVPPMKLAYGAEIDKAAADVTRELAAAGTRHPAWCAVELLEEAPGMDAMLPAGAGERVAPMIERFRTGFDGEADIAIAEARYRFASEAAEKAVLREGTTGVTMTDRIDRVVLNRWLGLPIFLAVMYVMFLFTQNFGGAFIDFFDILFGGIFVDGFGTLLTNLGAPEWLKDILADGIGGGIQTVSTFIPPIFFLFFFLAILEDSGYMARAAFVMDRMMRALGLPGKAFVPLLVGFGCGVPAIMATRTMDRAVDRIVTILMAPFMSCGARLPVYVLFATAFFPTNGQNLVFGIYLVGILAAILTGFLIKRFVLPGEAAAFVMEIPPYHLPTVKGVMMRTWDRLKAFVNRAGRVIVVIVAVLSFLNSWGTDGSFGNEDTDHSVLSEIGQTIAPVLSPMGVTQENWPAAVGIFTGILAKEAVVGTMNSLYDAMARTENAKAAGSADEGAAAAQEEEDSGWSLAAILAEAGTSIVDNLKDMTGAFADPLGVSVGDLSDTEAAAEEQGVAVDSIAVMQKLFGSQLAAFAYLMMVLLYMPCVAAIAAVYREAGAAWTLFLAAWTTVLGYSAATIVYRVGTFAEDPVYAVTAIGISVALLAGLIAFMRNWVSKNHGKGPRIIPIAVRA